MKLSMPVGAEPKKIGILVVLLAAAGYFFYSNVFSSGESVTVPTPAPKPAAAPPVTAPREVSPVRTAVRVPGGARGDFRPSLKPGKDSRSAADIDPTLRTDLLAKLSEVKIERVERSLFDFGAGAADPAKPKLPEPKIVVKKPEPKFIGPMPPPPPPPPPVPPKPPAITLKFYGNALPQQGAKRVFCIINDEVMTPAEGEILQRRYRIVRINATSVVVEDMDFKNQQTLPIETPPAQTGD